MSWQGWLDALRDTPEQAVAGLLRGSAELGPYERASAHEFLLAVLPRAGRSVSVERIGEPKSALPGEEDTELLSALDQGLAAWLLTQRSAPAPAARKLGAHAAQLCEGPRRRHSRRS